MFGQREIFVIKVPNKGWEVYINQDDTVLMRSDVAYPDKETAVILGKQLKRWRDRLIIDPQK